MSHAIVGTPRLIWRRVYIRSTHSLWGRLALMRVPVLRPCIQFKSASGSRPSMMSAYEEVSKALKQASNLGIMPPRMIPDRMRF